MRQRSLESKHTAAPVPRLEFDRPEFKGLRQRRFLACVSAETRSVNHVWVDDEGTCRGYHPRDSSTDKLDWSKWHLYQQRAIAGEPPSFIAVRCPSTLDADEWKRVRNDDPPGAKTEILRSMLADATASKRKARAAGRGSATWEDEA